MKTVRLSHVYDHPPQAVWDVATDFDCLKEAMRGLITFKGMPSGTIHKGQVINVEVSMFGLLPYQPYRMELVELDPVARHFKSDEQGMGVDHWQHSLRVLPHARGAELVDEIEIEAGWRTSVVCAWARYMYKRRHKPRLEMLARHSS